MRTFATTTELMAHQRDAVAKVSPSRVGALFMGKEKWEYAYYG